MSTIISPSFKWIVYIDLKIIHSLNPMVCLIAQKGPSHRQCMGKLKFQNVTSHDLYALSF